MGTSCNIIPRKKNIKTNKIEDSKLFKDLLSFTKNRELTIELYYKTKNEEFINKFKNRLVFDDREEPTLSSLFEETDYKDIIENSKILKKLNEDIGAKSKNKEEFIEYNKDDYKELISKAIEFNSKNEYKNLFVANVDSHKNSKGDTVYTLKIEEKNLERLRQAKAMQTNNELTSKMIKILESLGISIGSLTEAEERLGINGVTDFSKAKEIANGFIELIRLAKGEKGQLALPEEFAHVTLEALGEKHPLVSRLIDLIVKNNLAESIIGEEYEQYAARYKEDSVKLAKEAAGKLVAKHFLNNEQIKNKPYKSLLTRLIEAIKNLFKKGDIRDFENAIAQAEYSAGYLAEQILNNSLVEQMSLDNIVESQEFYSLEERVKQSEKILNKALETEIKRMIIYKNNQKENSTFDEAQKKVIIGLKENILTANTISGIYEYLEETFDTLRKINERLKNKDGNNNLNEQAKILREIRNYYFSYKEILYTIKEVSLKEEEEDDDLYEEIRPILNKTEVLLNDVYSRYMSKAYPLFTEFLKPFIGEVITIRGGKYKGKTIKLEQLIKGAKDLDPNDENYEAILYFNRDIGFFDRWLDSMADSNDFILKMYDQAVRNLKENARLNTNEYVRQLYAAGKKLEDAGYKSTDWMFEKDEDDNLTGNYITEINYGVYEQRRKKFFDELNKKYDEKYKSEAAQKDPIIKESLNRQRSIEARKWYNKNTERDPITKTIRPKKSIYGNKVYENMSSAQREFYDTIKKIKEEHDSYLPENKTEFKNIIKIRKELIERVTSSKSLKDGSKSIVESIKDEFLQRSDDTDFGINSALRDFEGRIVNFLPIYYLNTKEGESYNDMSTDVVSTMCAYVGMAQNYNELSKSIHILELGRDLLQERELSEEKSNKLIEERTESLGVQIKNPFTKKSKSYFLDKLNSFFEMQIFHQYIKDEGTFGDSNVSKAKLLDFINKFTSFKGLAFNGLAGISNVLTGDVMMRIETFSQAHWTYRDAKAADGIYAKHLPAFLANIGHRIKDDKLSLFDEMFDVLQEYETEITDMDFERKKWFSKMFGSNTLFVLNNAGEHWMQNRTALALAHKYKLINKNTKEKVNLWEALEIVYLQKDGTYSKNKTDLGAKLEVSDKYVKEDGTTFTKEDIIKFGKKALSINQGMHGIYNKTDKAAFQQLAVGRMAFLFRKWIIPSLNKRFKNGTENLNTENWEEGYYRTFCGFLNQLRKDLKEGQFSIAASWNKLDAYEKQNIRRALTELATFAALCITFALIDWPDDKKKNKWFLRMLEYQIKRLITETGAMIPIANVTEGLKLLESPAASINVIEDCIGLVGLLNPYNYETIAGKDALIQKGRFKGESKATKLIVEFPPTSKTIYRFLHPEETLSFFN